MCVILGEKRSGLVRQAQGMPSSYCERAFASAAPAPGEPSEITIARLGSKSDSPLISAKILRPKPVQALRKPA